MEVHRFRAALTQIAHVEALFYIIVLMFTLITLVLAVVLRESPQL